MSLQQLSFIALVCVCVCVCACVRARSCVRVCVCVRLVLTEVAVLVLFATFFMPECSLFMVFVSVDEHNERKLHAP